MIFSDIASVLNVEFQEPLADLVNNENPTLRAITKRGVASQRIYLKGRVGGDHGAGPVLDSAAVTFTGNEGSDYIAPVVDWSTYIAKFHIPSRALEQASNNPGELGRLFETEVMEAGKELANTIAAHMFGGVTANGLIGAQAWIDNGNTVAGIDRTLAANENFRSVVIDLSDGEAVPAGTELSTLALYRADQEFFDAVGYGLSERAGQFTGVTSSAIHTKYKQLLENIDLSALSAAHFVNRVNTSGNLGVSTIGWQGIPLIRDRNVSVGGSDLDDTSRIYFLDTSKLNLCVLQPNSNLAQIHQSEGMLSAPEVDGIRTSIHIMGRDGERIQGYVRTYIQMATSDPKRAGLVVKNVLAV